MDLKRLEKLKLDHPADGQLDHRPRRWIPWVAFLLILVIAGVAVAYFMLPRSRGIEQREAVAVTAQEQTPGTAPASSDRFTAAGYLEPAPPYPITVSAVVPGRLDQFRILEGTPVHAGQAVAKLDSAQLQLQLSELEAQSRVTDSKLSQARTLVERTQQSAANQASTEVLDRARAEVASGEADQQQIEAAIARVKWQIQNTEVRAPADGVVLERLKNVGDFVSPDGGKDAAALLTIYDPTKIQAWVDVTQRDVSRVSVGQRVEVSLEAVPGKAFEGRVTRILPRASLQKNTIQVKVSIADPTSMFRPDMSVKITFHSDNAQGAATKQ
jgi:RND family efflux transporter MFP subunit